MLKAAYKSTDVYILPIGGNIDGKESDGKESPTKDYT